jgi:hypothetical protein
MDGSMQGVSLKLAIHFATGRLHSDYSCYELCQGDCVATASGSWANVCGQQAMQRTTHTTRGAVRPPGGSSLHRRGSVRRGADSVSPHTDRLPVSISGLTQPVLMHHAAVERCMIHGRQVR